MLGWHFAGRIVCPVSDFEAKGNRLIPFGGSCIRCVPLELEAALKNQINQFVIDGGGGRARRRWHLDFNPLHSRKHDDEVQLYALSELPSVV